MDTKKSEITNVKRDQLKRKQTLNYQLTGLMGAAAYKCPNFAELQPIHAYIYTQNNEKLLPNSEFVQTCQN